MAKAMTSHERFRRMFAHQEADRIPIIDSPWDATIERWHQEGLPEGMSFVDYFDLDKMASITVDNSPRYEEKVIAEDDSSVTYTSKWGATLREWKHAASTPEFLGFTIVDRPSWEAAKARITPSKDRIPWERLRQNYKRWREEGYWLTGTLWFGFDVTHAWIIGTERMLMALVEDPEWVMDMFEHLLETNLTLFDMMWEEGYRFDSVFWYDDMGYKHRTFFSLRTYREVLQKYHQRAIDWAHAKGIKAHLHSCGDIHTFVPELVDMGLDGLNPLEVKAGMDPMALKKEFGDRLLLHGGINAVLWDQPEAIIAEMEKVVPVLKQNGGYVFSSDHSVPSAVSLEDFRRIIDKAKELGAY
jgi:uroporphyrinogen decarboxylase